jgi:hypothetical protein
MNSQRRHPSARIRPRRNELCELRRMKLKRRKISAENDDADKHSVQFAELILMVIRSQCDLFAYARN